MEECYRGRIYIDLPGPGDPSLIKEERAENTAASGNGPQIEVNGTQYTIPGSFSDALIPGGFTKGRPSMREQPVKSLHKRPVVFRLSILLR